MLKGLEACCFSDVYFLVSIVLMNVTTDDNGHDIDDMARDTMDGYSNRDESDTTGNLQP